MLRKVLLLTMVGLLAMGILAGYNIAFAQEIASDADKLDQGANTIWMFAAFLNQYQGENYIKVNPKWKQLCRFHFGFSLVPLGSQRCELALVNMP